MNPEDSGNSKNQCMSSDTFFCCYSTWFYNENYYNYIVKFVFSFKIYVEGSDL